MVRPPAFYDPRRIGTLRYPEIARIIREAEGAGLPPASEDTLRVQLLIIDMQVDFCHPQGSLFVPGAPADVERLIEFIYRQAGRLTRIACSLDTHVPFQIFHPGWWEDARGRTPEPFSILEAAQVEGGKWRPRLEPEWSLRYPRELERQSRHRLTLWPYHVLRGSAGHLMEPELWSAVLWHSVARRTPTLWWPKGEHPLTEHYSVVKPEIVPPGGLPESRFLEEVMADDRLLVAGEAASHCVLETLRDLAREFESLGRGLDRIWVLRDCTSPVQHPEIDFEAEAREGFRRLEERGMRFLSSTDPLPF